MKIALFAGFVFFCSTWTIGTQMRDCYWCPSSKSYEDCEKTQKHTKCYDTTPCIQMYARFDNGSMKVEMFFKGCAHHRACEQFSKGNLTLDETGCWHHSAICKGKCCYEDECNKGNILADMITGDKGNTGHNSRNNSGKAISSSVVCLFFCLSLLTAYVN